MARGMTMDDRAALGSKQALAMGMLNLQQQDAMAKNALLRAQAAHQVELTKALPTATAHTAAQTALIGSELGQADWKSFNAASRGISDTRAVDTTTNLAPLLAASSIAQNQAQADQARSAVGVNRAAAGTQEANTAVTWQGFNRAGQTPLTEMIERAGPQLGVPRDAPVAPPPPVTPPRAPVAALPEAPSSIAVPSALLAAPGIARPLPPAEFDPGVALGLAPRRALGRYKRGTTRVPGEGTEDTVPALLAPDEAVLNRPAADMMGRGMIAALNHMGNLKMGLA